MKIFKKIIQTFLSIFILVILPVVIFTFITSRWPLIAGIRSFSVLSGSMTPTLPVGSLIFAQAHTTYTTGDIISFENATQQTVTHRIAKVINENNMISYQTKGDANNTVDSTLVKSTDVIGAEVFSLPMAGYFIYFLKSPLGFFSSIIFPITVFLVFELWNLKKEIEKEVEKKILKKMQNNSVSV